MDDIGRVLPSLFRKEIGRAEPHLVEILQPLWPRIAGDAIAQHSRPFAFGCGMLTLATDGASWNTVLRHMSADIRARINAFLGQPVVKKLRFKTLRQTERFSPPPARRQTFRAPLSGPLPLDTAAIADAEVAEVLTESYRKYFNRSGR